MKIRLLKKYRELKKLYEKVDYMKKAIVAQVNCKKCHRYFESFKIEKVTGIGDIKCPICNHKSLEIIKTKFRTSKTSPVEKEIAKKTQK